MRHDRGGCQVGTDQVEAADRLEAMLDAQWALQQRLGNKYAEMTLEERITHVKDMVLAATDELHEALGEIGWKPWATSRHLNEDAAFGELRDAWQFLTNAMFAVTTDAPEHLAQRLFDALMDKLEINHERIERGYDGVSDKCPGCGRALDEVNVREIKTTMGLLPRVDLHCSCGRYLGSRPV